MQQPGASWFDRAIGYFAPQVGLRRARARAALQVLVRHYEGAASGRRTQGWHRSISDANLAISLDGARLRDVARDLVRNNPHAKAAIRALRGDVIGWGIVARPETPNAKAEALWKEWAETKACDADGVHDFYGLQKLVLRTVVEAGECFVRRRFRRPDDGLPIPLQLQVLEPDYLDTQKTGIRLPNGGRITLGVEYSPIGQRVAYWMFPEHPGSELALGQASQRISAENILHVFDQERPGQARGVSWFSPVLLRFKDFDEYEDATLMKQKIAACLAVITSDVDGSAQGLGATDSSDPLVDRIEPGMILNAAPGRSIEVIQPPSVREYADYSKTSLRAIATGIGVTYEDLTGDYTGMPFSAARMSRLRYWGQIEDWRWRMVIPQFCAPVWAWAFQVAEIFGLRNAPKTARWSAPPMPMIEPDKEGIAYQRNVRSGIMSLSEAIRERGYDPEELWAEMAADWRRIDALKLILDSDPRNTTQQGLPRAMGTAPAPSTADPLPEQQPKPEPAAPAATPPSGEDDDDEEE